MKARCDTHKAVGLYHRLDAALVKVTKIQGDNFTEDNVSLSALSVSLPLVSKCFTSFISLFDDTFLLFVTAIVPLYTCSQFSM